jgi:hypothetical protein
VGDDKGEDSDVFSVCVSDEQGMSVRLSSICGCLWS